MTTFCGSLEFMLSIFIRLSVPWGSRGSARMGGENRENDFSHDFYVIIKLLL